MAVDQTNLFCLLGVTCGLSDSLSDTLPAHLANFNYSSALAQY